MHFQNKYQIWADPKEVSAWVQSDTSHPIWTSQLKKHPRLKILPWGWWDNLPVLQRQKEFTFKIKRQNANLNWKEMMIWIDNKTIININTKFTLLWFSRRSPWQSQRIGKWVNNIFPRQASYGVKLGVLLLNHKAPHMRPLTVFN